MATNELYNTKDKEANQKATVATVVTALLLLLALVFITFSVNAKQEDLEEGILVNFGTSNVGSGKIQPQRKADKPLIQPTETKQEQEQSPAPKPQSKPKAAEQPAKEKPVLTQKDETAVVNKPKTAPKPEPKKKDSRPIPEADKPQPKPVEKPSTAESETEPTPTPAPKPAPKQPDRVYGGKKNVPSGGEGNDNQPGDKGQPDGSPDKGAYDGRNSGLGDSGVGYSLSGRKLVKTPSVSDNTNIEGKVTVNIKVDQKGNVISASLGKPTTISNNSLIQKSITAAKQAKFDANRNASEEQFGTMTFVYKVR